MNEKSIGQEFRLKNTNKNINDFIEEINQNELMTKKYKKICEVVNYTEHLFILVSTVSRCVSNFAFASLVGIPVGKALQQDLKFV